MTINILTFDNLPILEQLHIEEGLLKTSEENFILLNSGSPRAIIMGISSKKEEVVNLELSSKDQIPIIQRFTGGGTVIVDENTLFVTFIFQKDLHDFELYPTSILNWAGYALKSALNLSNFTILGNDFTLNEKKIGGNAQYIKKNRFLHHTSFVHDFTPSNMNYLLHPPKEPLYRQGRTHCDFLTPLAPHLSKEEFKTRIITYFSTFYTVNLDSMIPTFASHRRSTQVLL